MFELLSYASVLAMELFDVVASGRQLSGLSWFGFVERDGSEAGRLLA